MTGFSHVGSRIGVKEALWWQRPPLQSSRMGVKWRQARYTVYSHQITRVNNPRCFNKASSGSPTSLNSHPLSDSSNMCQNVPVNRDYSVIKPTSWVQIDKQPSLKLLLCCKRKANQIQVWIANRFIATWIWIEMLSNKVMKIRCKIGCTNRLRISYRWIRTLHISFLYILVFSILDTLNNL